ncbi:hypothetical protein [Myroides phaeus]|uniref:hypothetical protein n=1 Tax=Myroides phaeus TaxID=702745 RepID=UPI0013033438|nr:hypothetical protein [Myroides phaeus]
MTNPFIRIKASDGRQYLINIHHIVYVERVEEQKYAIHLVNDTVFTNTNVEELLDSLLS